MSILHINRLKNIFDSQIREHIDIENLKKEKPSISYEELENLINSQCYLLFALKNLTTKSYIELSKHLTDGFKDNGIDGIYYSKADNELFICQSKWNKKGQCSINKGELLKFLEGIYDLLSLNFEKFNDKVKRLAKLIEEAIITPNIKITVIVAHSGNNIASELKVFFDEKIDELNDTDEVIYFTEYNLVLAYTHLKESVEGEPINFDVDLYHWGYTNEPFKSYYGTINCGQIAQLLSKSTQRIYSKNIRSFIGITNINSDIVTTLIKEPENFFYLNNGIVLLCKEVQKSPYNSGKRENGKFTLLDVSIVNGAQTAGAISFAFQKQPDKVTSANVFIKIISLEGTPHNFGRIITIASNTQNKIEKRDFVSLDEQQKRLVDEFYLSGAKYHVKRNDEEITKDNKNYYFEEATVSLACFQENEDYSTYAKREIGKLWEDNSYKLLFNSALNVGVLINLIVIYRSIENSIRECPTNERQLCNHAIYLLTNIIYQHIGKEKLLNPNFAANEYLKNSLHNDFKRYKNRLIQVYADTFQSNRFPLSIFKNFNYCRKLKEEIFKREGLIKTSNPSLTLFDDLE